MGHHIMDVACECEAVFVAGCLLPGLALPVPFGHALSAQPDALAQEDQNGQP
jgi:hypothetical protein